MLSTGVKPGDNVYLKTANPNGIEFDLKTDKIAGFISTTTWLPVYYFRSNPQVSPAATHITTALRLK